MPVNGVAGSTFRAIGGEIAKPASDGWGWPRQATCHVLDIGGLLA